MDKIKVDVTELTEAINRSLSFFILTRDKEATINLFAKLIKGVGVDLKDAEGKWVTVDVVLGQLIDIFIELINEVASAMQKEGAEFSMDGYEGDRFVDGDNDDIDKIVEELEEEEEYVRAIERLEQEKKEGKDILN